MERSSADQLVRTVRPTPPKVLKMTNAADASFLMWPTEQQPALSLEEGRKKCVDEINVRRRERYAKHMEEHQSYLDSM
jgi:hypothetical protein